MLNPDLKSIELLKNEYKIYSRQLVLNQIGIEGQKRLKSAKILFIGAGALAAPAIIYLAASGIGHIGIIDKDKVIYSNLHRQILYNYNHINKTKVNTAKSVIKSINPLCEVTVYNEYLSEFNSTTIIKTYDIVIDSCDNFRTRYVIDLACHKLHKTHIYGAVQEFTGQLSVFNYKNGPRYQDIYPQHLDLEDNRCDLTGILGVLPGTIGILQATEAIKIILGFGTVLSGYLLTYNCLELSFKVVRLNNILRKNKKSTNTVAPRGDFFLKNHTISLNKLEKSTGQTPDQFLLIDVRHRNEFNMKHIPKSINIPLKQLKSYKTVYFIKKCAEQKRIIIYCNNTSRSMIASKILEINKVNHNITNLEIKT